MNSYICWQTTQFNIPDDTPTCLTFTGNGIKITGEGIISGSDGYIIQYLLQINHIIRKKKRKETIAGKDKLLHIL